MQDKRSFICEEKPETTILVSTEGDKVEDCISCPVKNRGKGSIRYAWIGAGQCGGRLVKSFYDLGYRNVLAVDTKGHDLDLLDLPQSQKLLINNNNEKQDIADPNEVSQIFKRHRQEILNFTRQTFGAQVDRIMICFGAGGNTGSGSVIELVEIAKKCARYIGIKHPGKKVGVIMSLPSLIEADHPQVARNAYDVSTRLCQMAAEGQISPLIILDNEKVAKIRSGMTIQSYWYNVNYTVASLFDMFNRFSNLSSPYTCFDPVDYDSIMSSGGCLIMGTAKVDRLDDAIAISKAAEDSLRTTLFVGGEDLSSAKVAGCVIVGGYELMAHIKGLQDNIDYAFDILSEVTIRATSYRGIYEDNIDGLSLYTIIGGLDAPNEHLQEMIIDLGNQPKLVDAEQNPEEEIIASAEHFLAEQIDAHDGQVKTLSQDTMMLLTNYSWPENGLKLADAIEHAYDFTAGSEIPPDALPFEMIFANKKLYSEQALTIIDKVKLRIVHKQYDEFLENLLNERVSD